MWTHFVLLHPSRHKYVGLNRTRRENKSCGKIYPEFFLKCIPATQFLQKLQYNFRNLLFPSLSLENLGYIVIEMYAYICCSVLINLDILKILICYFHQSCNEFPMLWLSFNASAFIKYNNLKYFRLLLRAVII